MPGCGMHRLQMGSSFPIFFAEDEYFRALRTPRRRRDIRITSLFTSHRELGLRQRRSAARGRQCAGDGRGSSTSPPWSAPSPPGPTPASCCATSRTRREPGLRVFIENVKEPAGDRPDGRLADADHGAHVLGLSSFPPPRTRCASICEELDGVPRGEPRHHGAPPALRRHLTRHRGRGGTGAARQLEPLRDGDPLDVGVPLQEHGRDLQLHIRLRPGGTRAGHRGPGSAEGLIDANAARFPAPSHRATWRSADRSSAATTLTGTRAHARGIPGGPPRGVRPSE